MVTFRFKMWPTTASLLFNAWLLLWVARPCECSIRAFGVSGTENADGDFVEDGIGIARVSLADEPESPYTIINPFTHLGCFSVTGNNTGDGADATYLPALTGTTPLFCVLQCEALGTEVAGMRGSSCYCLPSANVTMEQRGIGNCTTTCRQDYFNGTAGVCGGPEPLLSIFKQYDFVHQTASGCIDPLRVLWYQSVAIEEVDSATGYPYYSWYLHASSGSTGDPIFPYHQPLDRMHFGLQYDLDDSRIIGQVVTQGDFDLAAWSDKASEESDWAPEIRQYKVTSKFLNDIQITPGTISYTPFGSDYNDYLLNVGVSAIDAINNVYYVAYPIVPTLAGVGLSPPDFTTRLYGILLGNPPDTDNEGSLIVNELLEDKVLVLEANSEYNTLFGLLQRTIAGTSSHYYVKFGRSVTNNFTGVVEFNWQYESAVESVVNSLDFEDFVDLYYQIGATAVDHINRKSYIAYKELPNADEPFHVLEIDQRGSSDRETYLPIPSPATQGFLLLNADPLIPLTLPAPVLISAVFALDARSITVSFDSATLEGQLPIDDDGDGLPDRLNTNTLLVDRFDCAEVFARTTAEILGVPPDTECEFASSSIIRIYVPRSNAIEVGQILSLKDATIYAFRDNEWSYASSGSVAVDLPDPLLPPTIGLAAAVTADLCDSVSLNAENAFNDGGTQLWTWTLLSVSCQFGATPTEATTENVENLLLQSTGGGPFSELGEDRVDFGTTDLEPGCTYSIQVNLTGRWEVTGTQTVQLFKQALPAPQVGIFGLDELETFRSVALTIQTTVTLSSCFTDLAESLARRYEWTTQVNAISPTTGLVVQEDVTLDGVGLTNSVLTLRRFTLSVDTTYVFTVRVANENQWEVEGASSEATATVAVTRAPVAAYVRGGSRDVQRNVFAVDGRVSFDPDFPDTIVGDTDPSVWTFTYSCTDDEGLHCFDSDEATGGALTVSSCTIEDFDNTFMDLNIDYPNPTYTFTPSLPSTYYCSHPTENGVLLVSVPADGNYTFKISLSVNCDDPLSTCRTATTTASIFVEVAGVDGPEVDFTQLEASKVVTTDTLRVSGNIVEEDVATYGDEVNYSWSFTRVEVVGSGTTLVEPPELDTSISITSSEYPFLSNPLTSQHLVIKADQLMPSSTYNFRLSATTPHPLFPGQTVTGFGTLTINTAGAAPSGGTVTATPTESDMNTVKIFVASEWTAEDLPLNYMFYYRGSADSNRYPLRVAPATEVRQDVNCLKAGEEAEDFVVIIELVICSSLGACSTYQQDYVSTLPADWVSANTDVLALLDDISDELQSTVMSCLYVPTAAEAFIASLNTDQYYIYYSTGAVTTSTTTTTISAAQLEAFQEQVTAAVTKLLSLQDSTESTMDGVTGNMQTVQALASSGLPISDDMIELVESLAADLEELAEAGEATSDETENAAGASFNALGEMNSASNNADDTAARRRLKELDVMIVQHVQQKKKEIHERRMLDKKRRLTSSNPCLGIAARVGAFPSLDVRQEACSASSSFDEAEEALENAWLSGYSEIEALASQSAQASVTDEQYISNYTAHLSVIERDTVLRRWWAEKARLQARTDELRASKARVTRTMFEQISRICGVIVKQMATNEDPRTFTFPMGEIKVGKNLDLLVADASFQMPDSQWRLGINSAESWGWACITFNQDPLIWADGNPISGAPSKIFSLSIYEPDGQEVEVSNQAIPLTLMSDQDGLAQSTCSYFDWTGDNGRGGWSRSGVLSNTVGCKVTHLSVIGQFLDVSTPVAELPEAFDAILGETTIEWNYAVIVCVALGVVFGVVFHYWGFKQDEIDIYKVQEDDEDDPKHEVQRMTFKEQFAQIKEIFVSMLLRDHIAVSVFCRDKKRKATRLQKASVFFAALSGVAAVAALFFGEHITDPKHYVEVGIISAIIIFPMVRLLRLLFVSNPFGGVLALPPTSSPLALGANTTGASQASSTPLVGKPVEDEDEMEQQASPVHYVGGAGQAAAAAAPQALPEAQGPLYLPALDPVAAQILPAVPPPPPRTAGTTEEVPAPPPRPGSAQMELPSQPEGTVLSSPPVAESGAALVAMPSPQERIVTRATAGSAPESAVPTSVPSVAMSDDNLGGPSRAQVQAFRRVRRMYIESVIMSSERMVYDERVDLRSTETSPLAQLVNILAHTAVACYWVVAVVVTICYVVHLSAKNALRWFYACVAGWIFVAVVLEFVRIALLTIIENQQQNLRRRVIDRNKLEQQVAMKRDKKRRQMDALLGLDTPAADVVAKVETPIKPPE